MSYVPVIGRVVDGRYRIERQLGDGGMGAVFRARDAETGATVALKMMKASALNEAPTARARFSREANVDVPSPHLAQVLGRGTTPDTGEPYIVMEHFEGEDLSKALLRLGPLPVDTALRIAAQACSGVEDAHAAGFVHRDIKPANLFLAREGDDWIVVKVLDFGVAKLHRSSGDGSPEATGLTRTSNILGSPLYMAPEQVRGSKDVDRRADVWSLGVVLYRMLAGRAPHQPIQTLGALVLAVCNDPPPPLSEVAPWVPAEVVELVHAALQLEPDDRYGSAAEMLETISALLPEGSELRVSMLRKRLRTAASVPPPASVSGTRPAPTSRATALTAQTVPPSPSAGALEPPAARRRWLIPLLAAVALGVGLGAASSTRRASKAAPVDAGVTALVDEARPSPSARRVIKVSIAPADALVEVDGRPASLRDGVVEIAGELGSVHRVRVTRGAVELVELVVVGADGSAPAQIRLRDP